MNNSAILTILVDNITNAGLVQEHGFALWLEVAGHYILFDTGQGNALAPNVSAMGIDLGLTDILILSHGHYDHTGGIAEVLSANPAIRVFSHPGIFAWRYSIHPDHNPHNISIPVSAAEALNKLPSEQYCRLKHPAEILPGIGLTGTIPRKHPLEDTGGPFFLDPDGLMPDSLEDDMAMWINTAAGLVIITGCCHSGLINTVGYIREITGTSRIQGIIGGLHLNKASLERLNCTCDALRQWHPQFVIPCHCTGKDASDFLTSRLGNIIKPAFAGLIINF